MHLPAAPSSPSLLLSTALFLFLGALCCSAAGAAGTITAFEVDELVVDRVSIVRVGATSPPGRDHDNLRVFVAVNPSSLPCAADADENYTRALDRDVVQAPEPGQFASLELRVLVTQPAEVRVCGYLEDVIVGEVFATTEVERTVRAPRTSLTLGLAGTRFAPGETTTLSASASSEVIRQVSVKVSRFPEPCGTTLFGAQYVDLWINNFPILGGPHSTERQVTAPYELGLYRTCGFIDRGGADDAPTTAIEGPPFWVGPEPRCRVTAVPRQPSGSLRLRCTRNVTGPVTVRARARTVQVQIAGGRGSLRANRLGLTRGRSTRVAVAQGDTALGSRRVRLR